MKVISPASQLWRLVKQMEAELTGFVLTIEARPPPCIDIDKPGGIDVVLEDVKSKGGLLDHEGRQVVLYIPDQGRNIDDVLVDGWNKGKKVHVADCKVLDNMREKNRFERYRAVANTSGMFEVFGTSYQTGQHVEGTASLRACIVCLKHLNYKGYVTEPCKQKEILKSFNLEEFFLTYSTLFRTLPSSIRQKHGGYSSNWPEISNALRAKRHWRCEGCKLDLSGQRHLLDAHHVNGNKADNDNGNLQALCKDCHRKQIMHSHMGINSRDMVTIQRLRHEQGVLGGNGKWEDNIKLVDTSFEGLLRLYQKRNSAMPEIGYDIVDSRGAVSVQAEIAWPNKKLAVVMDDEEKQLLEASGWRAQTLAEALRDYQ